MLFNSLEFPLFLGLVLLGHYAVIPRERWRARKAFLLVASYAFYASWSPFFALILLGTTILDYGVGLGLERTASPGARRALIGASLLGNLGLLGYFKYGNFLAENLHRLLGPWGLMPAPAVDIILPVGISFYTFQSISYTIDVYRRQLPAARRLLDFALYVSFFPQLVAGPIVRAGDFLPQFARAPRVASGDVERAVARIAGGYLKKVVVADTLGAYVDMIFGAPGIYRGWNLLLAVYAYAYQIYFDFAGYSDIAIGVAALFGMRLPENFNRPYFATSPREFWWRWHISLSTWLRDYLYVSLGGNRLGAVRTHVNLLVTMLLGGLWHGAAWTFVVWGAYHGVLLSAHRMLAARWPWPSGRLGTLGARLLTFHLVCLGWLVFRSPSLGDAWRVVSDLWTWEFLPSRGASLAAALIVLAIAVEAGPTAAAARERFVRLSPWWQGLGYAVAVVLVFLFSPATARFIYFQF